MSLIRKIADSAWGASDGELQIGQNLPAVSSKSHKDEVIEFEGLRDEPYVFVYFYPKADTPGCTKQACSLRDAYEELCEKGVLVFGVSKDNVKDQNAFVDKYDLPFTLIADSYGEVVQAFGVPVFPGIGMPKRQAFLFKGGELVWRDLAASTEEQAKDVLAYLEAQN